MEEFFSLAQLNTHAQELHAPEPCQHPPLNYLHNVRRAIPVATATRAASAVPIGPNGVCELGNSTAA